jgi:hypothetical protein
MGIEIATDISDILIDFPKHESWQKLLKNPT